MKYIVNLNIYRNYFKSFLSLIIPFKNRIFTNLEKTEQENFWMGIFGDEYIKRNLGEESSEGRNY